MVFGKKVSKQSHHLGFVTKITETTKTFKRITHVLLKFDVPIICNSIIYTIGILIWNKSCK